jgi:hypothetical protein
MRERLQLVSGEFSNLRPDLVNDPAHFGSYLDSLGQDPYSTFSTVLPSDNLCMAQRGYKRQSADDIPE